MKEKIIRISQGKEGVELPEEYLRYLDLIPGSEIELRLDKKNKWIILRPMHGTDFVDHFRDTMELMA